MLFSIFGDESADETQLRVFAVGALIGTEHEWELAEKDWTARTGGEVFHAAECEYEGKFGLYKDLTQILAKSWLAGVSVALDIASHRAVFRDPLDDVAYYKCLTDVLASLTRTAVKVNASDPRWKDDPVRLEFTFDHRKRSERNAGTLYSLLVNEPEWADAQVLGTKISFDCRTNPRIQMADLFTREAMKEFDRKIAKHRQTPRLSWQALNATDKFRFVEHDRTFLELWKNKLTELEQETGVNVKDYKRWLQDTGRVQNGWPHDNMGNRYRYFQCVTTRVETPSPI